MLLPQHDSDGAVRVAEQVRAAIEAHPFGLPDASCITASFGVSWLPSGHCFDDAYDLADQALYAAKRAGRNRVVRAAIPEHA